MILAFLLKRNVTIDNPPKLAGDAAKAGLFIKALLAVIVE